MITFRQFCKFTLTSMKKEIIYSRSLLEFIFIIDIGTIQSKVKDSFSLKQKPLLKKNNQLGQGPLFNGHIQSSKKTSILKEDSLKNIKLTQRIDSKRKFSDDLEVSTDSEVYDLREYPQCSMGVIIYEVGGHKKYGTGFLIGKNIVFTCAHNLFSLEYRQPVSKVCFCPGYSKDKLDQVYKAKQIFFPTEFEKLSQKENELSSENYCLNDFEIIKLQDCVDLQHKNGYLGFNFVSQQHNLASNKLIMGFTNFKNKSISLHSFTGKVKFTNQKISYPFITQIGKSGGPILQFVNGIHIFYKYKGKESNGQGLRLNQQIFDQINTWLKVYQEAVDLRDKSLGKEGVKQLVKLKKYSFDMINLSKNCLQKQGLKHFSRVQWPNLYHLDLGGNNLGNEGLQYLIKSSIKNLIVLNLWGNKIGKKGIQILVEGNWPKLQNLNLYNNQICIGALQKLVAQGWKFLNTLNLGQNRLGVQAIEEFKNNKWKNIVCLNLCQIKLIQGEIGLKTIKRRFFYIYLPKMKYLYL